MNYNPAYKLVKPWNPAFDMPHNKVQAIAVIGAWAGGAWTYSDERAARIHHLLTTDKPKQIAPQFVMHAGGCGPCWVFVVEEGHFGYFANCQQAQDAAWAAAKGK